MFMGEYHHTIDDKGRLTIPSKIRDNLGESFVVTRGLDDCLFIYPINEWTSIVAKYKDLPNTKDARNFMRIFLSGATSSTFDKQGRIIIPEVLMKYAAINKECVVIGVNERLEVWSKENWDKYLANSEEKISDIAEDLFKTNL